MEPAAILRLIAALACPIGMGLMMWWMMKNMNGEQSHSTTSHQAPADRVAALHAQRESLEIEIAEAARLAELEAKRQALLAVKKPTTPAQDNAEAPAS